MTKEIKKPKEIKIEKKPIKYIARKKLFTTKDGIVKIGEECTPTSKELELFKKVKAI
mgnify:FL=1